MLHWSSAWNRLIKQASAILSVGQSESNNKWPGQKPQKRQKQQRPRPKANRQRGHGPIDWPRPMHCAKPACLLIYPAGNPYKARAYIKGAIALERLEDDFEKLVRAQAT